MHPTTNAAAQSAQAGGRGATVINSTVLLLNALLKECTPVLLDAHILGGMKQGGHAEGQAGFQPKKGMGYVLLMRETTAQPSGPCSTQA